MSTICRAFNQPTVHLCILILVQRCLLMVDFGKRLKTLRIESGLTQQQVADRIWVNKASISSYELSTRLPSYEVLIKLSKLFNVSTDYLLGIENKVKANSIVDVSGLTEKQIVLLQKLIDELKQ